MFWIGVGAALTVMAARWMRKQREKFSPESMAAKMADGMEDLRALVRVSVEEGRRAMEQKEAELRAELGGGGPPG
ncbi:MAG: hypothetical protein ACRDH8_02595 [Actinomycetota bacterium]